MHGRNLPCEQRLHVYKELMSIIGLEISNIQSKPGILQMLLHSLNTCSSVQLSLLWCWTENHLHVEPANNQSK